MELCAERLGQNVSVMIFPEGTRSTTGDLLPFKDGAFRLAIETGVPVLPLAVHGAGTFLLRYFTATGDEEAGELARAAAVAVRCANWTAPPLWCHGLASDGDFLLECADVFGDPRYRDWAAEVA